MYNRYLPQDQGDYMPLDPDPSPTRDSPPRLPLLSSLFRRLKPDRLDKSDLMLAAILFLLYLESEEEEYLIAMALFFLL